MRALVVEDNTLIRQVIVDLLIRRGHDVAAFADAESAWATCHDIVFDLTVLDWYLPGLDGIDLCRRLRDRPGGASGAILILTGRVEPDDVDLVVAAGADDYLTKPFKLDWLDVRIAFAERKVADLAERARIVDALHSSDQRHRVLLIAAERQASELRLLHEVRTALAHQMDLPTVFRTVVDAVARSFGYTFVSAYLREGDDLVLQHQVGYTNVTERFSVTHGVAGRVLRTGVPVLLPDGPSDPDLLSATEGMVSEVCVPLSDNGQPIGVLLLETRHGRVLGDADLALMIALAEHIDAVIARSRLDSAARESEAQYRTVVEQVQEVIFQTDAAGNWTFLNPAWTEITGHVVADSLGLPAASFVYLGDRNRFLLELQQLTPNDGPRKRFEVNFLTATWETRCLEIHARPRMDSNNVQTGISGTLTDITERRRAEEELRDSQERFRHLALHDSLTGLPNRTLFLDCLEGAVMMSKRDGHGLAVLFIDLDGFKLVNDQLGHDAGDRLLELVAERLLGALIPADIVARLGGDEFAVLLEENVDRVRAVLVAHHLLHAIQEPFVLDGKAAKIGMSIGIALGQGDAITPGMLLRNADIALYEAKNAGRATSVVYEPQMSMTAAPARERTFVHSARSRPINDIIERRTNRSHRRTPHDRPTRGTGTLGPLPPLTSSPEHDKIVTLND